MVEEIIETVKPEKEERKELRISFPESVCAGELLLT